MDGERTGGYTTVDVKNRKGEIFELREQLSKFNNEVDYRVQYKYCFNISHNLFEIEQLANYIGNRKFNYFLEIGGANGGSLWFYSNLFCSSSAFIRCIEPKRVEALLFIRDKLEETGKSVSIDQAWSYTKNLCESIPDNTIDLLHIDGSHLYEDVKIDFELFYPKVKKGGIILMHDVISHEGSKKFIGGIGDKYNMIKFVDKDFGLGIGLIEKQ